MTSFGLVSLLLVIVALTFAGWGVRLIFRRPYSPVEWLLFYTAYLMARLLWRTTVSRPLSIGYYQGAIIVTNHRSSVDPFFIQLAVGVRRVHWMVAKEFIQHPAFRCFLRKSQVITTSRTGIDTAAIKQAIRYAAEGGLVGMFPEGRINRTDQLLLPVRSGAA